MALAADTSTCKPRRMHVSEHIGDRSRAKVPKESRARTGHAGQDMHDKFSGRGSQTGLNTPVSSTPVSSLHRIAAMGGCIAHFMAA